MTDAVAVHVTTAGGVDAEVAADALWAAGAAAIEERPVPDGGVLLVAATADGGVAAPLLAAVAGRWPAEVVLVDLAAALDAWRPHARAVVAGRVTVRPPWVPGSGRAGGTGGTGATGAVEVVVDPGRAFGSGSHATTRLALWALGDLVAGGERVLDLGCGSGVLAIAALALGAGHATATDVDPAALAATRDNAARNGVADRLTVVEALDRVPPASADVVVANVLAPVLVEHARPLAARLAPGGAVALSGFLAGRRAGVLDAYPGLAPVAEYAEDGWLAVTLRAP